MTEKGRVEWWFSAACAIPWLLGIGPYMDTCFFRLAYSRWPLPMLGDPKQFSTSPLVLLYSVFHCLSFLAFFAIPLAMVLALCRYRKILGDWRYSLRISAFALGLITIWLVNHYDPGRVWDWFLD